MATTLYLAGDLVFRPGAIALFDRLKAICAEYDIEGLAPFDGQEDVKELPAGRDKLMTIARADRALMDHCDAGIFCLDPFRRAPDMDAGTAVEIGYMHALGKPLEGYTVDGRDYPEKVADYWQRAWQQPLSEITGDDELSSGGWRDADGTLAHSEGMVQNLMVEGFIELSGGKVAVGTSLEAAFRQAVEHLSKRL